MALGRQMIIARATAPGTFAALCVTAQRSLEINNEEVDITKPDCASPGGKLAYAGMYGIQTFRVSGSGAFVNVASQKAAIADAVNQVVTNYQITVPDVGVFVGDGLISVTASGEMSNEMQAEFRLTLTGAITFTPAT
jgi:predicted secreted protein